MSAVMIYEIVALWILGIIWGLSIYRDWLDLKKNRIFMLLLFFGIAGLAIDLLWRFRIIEINSISRGMNTQIANVWMVFLCYLFYIYCYNSVGKAKRLFSVSGYTMGVMGIAVLCMMITNHLTHYVFWYDDKMRYHTGYGAILLLVFCEGLIITGLVAVFRQKKVITTKVLLFFMLLGVVVAANVAMQCFIPHKWTLTLFVFGILTVFIYLTMHMADQHLMRETRCFSRAGFRRVAEEKELYEENFAVLSVNITNLSSIINVCNEEEISEIKQIVADVLRVIGNSHYMYQIHSSEFILTATKRAKVEEYLMMAREQLPRVVRLNDKNVAVDYGFYVLEFSDVMMKVRDFYRILAGLRGYAKKVVGDNDTIYYQGEVRRALQRDLRGLNVLSDVLSQSGGFDIAFMPVFDTKDGKARGLETKMLLHVEEDAPFTTEEIWDIAEEIGMNKKTAARYVEDVIRFVSEEKILDSDIENIRINVKPSQINSIEAVDRYKDILDKYGVKPENIVFEVFMDQSISDEEVEEHIRYLKMQGFGVYLDQFGINVCNLKNLLKHSFDAVKINADMVVRFLPDKQSELEHLVVMLQKNNWDVMLDGVDLLDRCKELEKLGIKQIQGETIAAFLSKEDILLWMKEEVAR